MHELSSCLNCVSDGFSVLQLILSLAVLILCFLVTTISTIAIVLITRARRRRSRKNQESSSSVRSSPLIETKPAGEHCSPGAERRLSSRGRKQADAKDSGNYSVNFGINSGGRLPDPSWYEPSSSVGLSSSNKDDLSKIVEEDDDSHDDVSEEAPLLLKKREISPEPTTLGFGEMSASAGVWHRDASGKQLTRFIVLHMFLIFSMLMVGTLVVCVCEYCYC